MPRPQVRSFGIDDASYDGEGFESDSTVPTSCSHDTPHRITRDHVQTEDELAYNTPASHGLPTRLATYPTERGDTAAPRRRSSDAIPRSDIGSTAPHGRAKSLHRGRRSMGQPFPGVASVSAQQQEERSQDGYARRGSATTGVSAAGDIETRREADARRHHRRFLKLCGRLPETRPRAGTEQSATVVSKHTTMPSTVLSTDADGAGGAAAGSMDGTLSMRYGNGTRGVKERQEDEAKQRARTLKAEREQADTRRRRVSVFDRLIRRPSMRLSPSAANSRRGTMQDFALPPALPTSTRAATEVNPYAASPLTGANSASGGGGTSGVVLPALRTGNGFAQSPREDGGGSKRDRSAVRMMSDQDASCPRDRANVMENTSTPMVSTDNASSRTNRPVQRAVQFESGGIIDTFGYFPNHRTNTDYYKKIKRNKARQRRPVEVNRETGAVMGPSDGGRQMSSVPPMTEIDIDTRRHRRDRDRDAAATRTVRDRQSRGGGAARSRSSPQHGTRSRRPSVTKRCPETNATNTSDPQTAQQRQYRFYTVEEDGAVRGFDLEPPRPPSPGSAGEMSSMRATPSTGRSPLPRGPALTSGRCDKSYTGNNQNNRNNAGANLPIPAAAAAASGRDADAVGVLDWLADGQESHHTPPTHAFAVRVSEAKPYEDDYGHIVQTIVYPTEAGLRESRSRGVSLGSMASAGRDRWGEPMAPPSQTNTVVVRRYTNDNGSKPVRLHLPPGASLENLNLKDEFPSVSLPWLA